MSQSRIDSLMEAVCNVFIGFWIGVLSNYAILPLFGYVPKFLDSLAIAALFTIISLLRSYALRRLFNGRTVWASIKSKWGIK